MIQLLSIVFLGVFLSLTQVKAQDEIIDKTELPDPVSTPIPPANEIKKIEEYKPMDEEGVGKHGGFENIESKLKQLTQDLNSNFEKIKDFQKIKAEFETLKTSFDTMTKDMEEVKNDRQATLKKIEKLEKVSAMLVKKFPSIEQELQKEEKKAGKAAVPTPTPTP